MPFHIVPFHIIPFQKVQLSVVTFTRERFKPYLRAAVPKLRPAGQVQPTARRDLSSQNNIFGLQFENFEFDLVLFLGCSGVFFSAVNFNVRPVDQ